MTAKPLTGELFAEILGHVPNCRYGCVACEASPTLVAEIRRLRGERGDLAAKLAAATETVVKLAATRDTYAALLLTVDEIAYDKPVEFICGLLRQAMHAHFCGCPHPLQNQVFCARFPGHAGCHADGQQRWVPTVSAVEPQPESSP